MKKFLISIFCFFSFSVSADRLADAYFYNDDLVLTEQEIAGISIADKWRNDISSGIKPVKGPDGSIKYLFGAQQTSVVCAVMRVCDIALQPGEQVNGIHIGDAGRWGIEPAVSGNGASEVIHVLIKPYDVGIETSLFIATNVRTYNINLKSHKTKYMPAVSFVYPEDAMAKWDLLRKQAERKQQENTIPSTGEYLPDLNFDYSISGSASWRPVRVYNDNVKTIIQMPKSILNQEAPTLLVMRNTSGLFSSDETVMVNYRLHGDRYIVDSLFDTAILITGVGSNQTKVTIRRNK